MWKGTTAVVPQRLQNIAALAASGVFNVEGHDFSRAAKAAKHRGFSR
jgi:hypothetical protein